MINANAQHKNKLQTNKHSPSKPVAIQQVDSVKNVLRPKLKIGTANDKYEQEADKVAEHVIRMPDPSLTSSTEDSFAVKNPVSSTGTLQRVCAACAEDENLIQKKTGNNVTSEPTPDVHSSIQSLQGRGQPMSSSDRSYYEPRFGTDFSRVRLHTDTSAANTAQSVNARAFTSGYNVVFAAGQYSPNSLTGKKLFAHELTHVVQQNAIKSHISSRDTSSTSKTKIQTFNNSSLQHSIQRAVSQTPQENVQPGARACLVHLHGNEQNALQTGRSLFGSHCVNLVHLNNTGRCIDTGITGCSADPNRIFSTDRVTRSNTFKGCPCNGASNKNLAVSVLRQFYNQSLAPAISRCRGGNGSGISGPLPVVALHNNTPGALSIRSFRPGGSEARATETDSTRTGGAANPSETAVQNIDNFLLTTQANDFSAFRGLRNVVLQSDSPHDDGSLSVALAGQRYINVESEGKRFTNQAAASFVTNRTMAQEVLSQLGVTAKPCATPATTNSNTTATAQSGTAENNQSGTFLGRIMRWIQRLFREITQLGRILRRTPPARPRDTQIPRNIRSRCQIFNDQAQLDTAKTTWTGRISAMPSADVINWIIGVAVPPATVTRESALQRDCMLSALVATSRQNSSGINLPTRNIRRLTRSAVRDFSSQRDIWRRKFNFLRFGPNRGRGSSPRRFGSFGNITDPARRACGSLIAPTDTEWNPHNSRHRVCWNVNPVPGRVAPAIPTGSRSLTRNERQFEILQTSSAPGISRHHAGTDFDLIDPSMNPADWEVGGTFADEYSWLQSNASTYGFIQSFSASSTFMRTGYIEERWHWSYFPIAQALLEFANTNQSNIETALLSQWGSNPGFSFIQSHWREYMFNVNQRGRF